MKEMEEKRKLNQAVARMKAEEQKNETPAERRAREQAAIEEADYENALDAFGAEGWYNADGTRGQRGHRCCQDLGRHRGFGRHGGKIKSFFLGGS